MQYPFTPKSNKKLKSGDYWFIHLSDKSFAIGVVIDIPPPDLKLTREIIVGLLKWNKKQIPELKDFMNAQILEQGHVNIKTISYTGKEIIGNISLEEHNIIPLTMIGSYGANGKGFNLMKGYKIIGEFQNTDRAKFEMSGYWGYDYIQKIAENVFVLKNKDWL